MRNTSLLLFLLSAVNVLKAQQAELPHAKYPIKLIAGYCLNEETRRVFTNEYFYDWKKNLVKFVRRIGNDYPEEHEFENDQSGKTIKETLYKTGSSERTRLSYSLYTYSEDNLTKIEFYDDKNELVRTEEREYARNLVSRLDIYLFHNNTSRLQSFSKYTYDAEGKLISWDVFTGGNELTRSYQYEYLGKLMVKVIERDRGKEKTTMLEYDKDDHLLQKISDGKIVQENLWQDSHLVERNDLYFGIDPCRSMCCGKTKIKIEYY